MSDLSPPANKGIFCMLNCFDNYSIVAGKVIEFYIQNAAVALRHSPVKTMSYFEATPYLFYSMFLGPGTEVPGASQQGFSKQFTDYITILCLSAVTLARIYDANAVVYPHQGVTQNAGFATMYAYANMMNKVTAFWTDDLRNLWGTSEDPLLIGMAPLPYRYLWSSASKPGQSPEFNHQSKGMNGPITPNIGSSTNLCPKADAANIEKKFNTFYELLESGDSIQRQNNGGMSLRMKNMIKLGRALIQYVEVGKVRKYGTKFGAGGWTPGPAPNFNPTLFFDMQSIVGENLGLLYTQEQAFYASNTQKASSNILSMAVQAPSPRPRSSVVVQNSMGIPNLKGVMENQADLSQAMLKGLQAMTRNEETYEYFV